MSGKSDVHTRTAKQYFKELFSLFFVFFKIGLFLFGGGYAMLALLETELVDKRKWISKEELGDIFAIAESTPGPISVNTATFIGTKRLGIVGGIIATLGVVVPAFAIIAVISVILDLVIDNKWVSFLFKGIRIGVLVLILKAVLSFFKSMKKTLFSFLLMAVSFVLVFVVKADVVYVILGTVVICSIAVAFSACYKSRRYHISGTPPYYCARVGKPIENDEYFSQKAVEHGILTVKPPVMQNTASISPAISTAENALIDAPSTPINSCCHASPNDAPTNGAVPPADIVDTDVPVADSPAVPTDNDVPPAPTELPSDDTPQNTPVHDGSAFRGKSKGGEL